MKKSPLSKLLIFSVFVLNLNQLNSQSLLRNDPLKLPDKLEQAYIKGLNFLKRSQQEDGSFKLSNYGREPGVVALCLMAYLSHGDDPEYGRYAFNIKCSIDYLIKKANPTNGYIGNSMYNHAFATLALAEAYGMVMNDKIGPTLQKAVDLILSSQNRNRFGGWRYSPDSPDADTTVSGACIVALFAAANAGIKVPDENIKKALNFFSECQSQNGGVGYTNSQDPNSIRTAIAALAFTLAKRKETNEYKKAIKYLRNTFPDTIEQHYLHYGLYYISQAFFHSSKEDWEKWNSANLNYLISTQNEDGSWNSNFGPEFSTAASLLSLALNYRYLPIYER